MEIRDNSIFIRRLIAAGVAVICGSLLLYLLLTRLFLTQEVSQTNNRAGFFAATIEGGLRRLDHLPFVIAQDEIVVAALSTGDSTQINPLLAEFAVRADAEAIYVMDIDGLTLSSSNYDKEISFVGHYYTFRPYFRDAIAGKTGRFFAIGATTGRPGYFVSEAVENSDGDIVGVVVVKIGLAELNRSWRDSGERILVTNTEEVVLLSSLDEYLFGTLAPLSARVRAEIADRQQFADRPLAVLDWQNGTDDRVRLGGVDYLHTTAAIPREGWTLHLLTDLSGIRQRAALTVAGMAALLFAIAIAVTGFRSARLKHALRLSNADRVRLTQEIEDRRTAEAKLRDAQAELQRSSRLATLGQLSASITHELGQPISAMRNYLAAEEIGASETPGGLNNQLTGLVDRMQNITRQLRFFATPGALEQTVFDMRDAVRESLDLVNHGLLERGITLVCEPHEAPLNVLGDQHRFEQVLVNILRNALDAVADSPSREVRITFGQKSDHVFVRITDTGTGLQGRSIHELEEPFVTTKSSGEGMGLGLAISAQIVKELGGTMEATDAEAGGAAFTVSLPRIGETR